VFFCSKIQLYVLKNKYICTTLSINTQFYHLNTAIMKALKIAGIILAGLIILVLVLGLIAPKDFDLERSVVIDAPPDQVYPHVRYFAKQDAWYPWKKYDPNMETSVEGTDGEIGAVYKWSGNEDVGVGQQTITALEENKSLETDLQFIEPFESNAKAYIYLDEVPAGTEVKWGFTSEMPFPFNIMGLFMNMEKSVGSDYERGLEMLKEIVEKETPMSNTSKNYDIQTTNLPTAHYAALRKTVTFGEMHDHFQIEMPKLANTAMAKGGQMAGSPTALYYEWDEENSKADMALAIPLSEKVALEAPYTMIEMPATKALLVDHYGAYESVGDAHYAIDDYMKAHGVEMAELPVLEVYVTDPEKEPDTSKWLTKIYYPIQG